MGERAGQAPRDEAGRRKMNELLVLRPRELAVWAAAMLLGCLGIAGPRLVAGTPDGLDRTPPATTWRLDVNTASAAELELLPGIGPRRARVLMEARQKRGGFATVQELAALRGFSPALVRRLEPLAQAAAGPSK